LPKPSILRFLGEKKFQFFEKFKYFQNLRTPVKINYFFRFSVVDCPEKMLLTEKIHQNGQKMSKKRFFDFGQKWAFFNIE
jgi:hypothetical protein